MIQCKSSAIKVLRDYKISHLPFIRVMPEVPDFLAFPEVGAVLSQPKSNVPPTLLGVHSLRSVVLKLPWIMHFWRTEINRKLVNHFQKQELLHKGLCNYEDIDVAMDAASGSSGLENADAVEDCVTERKLSLATAVFICSTCSAAAVSNMMDCGLPPVPTPLFYPELFGHQCLTRSRPENGKEDIDPCVKLDGQQRYRTRWSCEELMMDMEIGRMVEGIVTACGLDPIHATAEDMDKCCARLVCERCVTQRRRTDLDKRQLQAFGWRRAVSGSGVA